jgi:hypothetical protein
MNDREQVKQEIDRALACPLDWATVFRVEGPASFEPLNKLWLDTVAKYEVDQESCYLGFEELSDVDDDELRQIQINVRSWGDRAKRDFLARTRHFTDLRYATRAEYGKHLPPLGGQLSPAEIQARSRKGPSLFYREASAKLMLEAFVHGIFFHFLVDEISGKVTDEVLWNKLLHDEHTRIAFKCPNDIGATDGISTQYLAYEFNASTPILHSYPISPAEAIVLKGECSFVFTDDLGDWGR